MIRIEKLLDLCSFVRLNLNFNLIRFVSDLFPADFPANPKIHLCQVRLSIVKWKFCLTYLHFFTINRLADVAPGSAWLVHSRRKIEAHWSRWTTSPEEKQRRVVKCCSYSGRKCWPLIGLNSDGQAADWCQRMFLLSSAISLQKNLAIHRWQYDPRGSTDV
jgi:hypothetical protein